MQSERRALESRSSTSTRWLAAIVVVGMIAAAGYLIFSRESSFAPSRAMVDGLPGTIGVARAAPDLPARTLDGQPLRLSELKGKVVILNFWATWCASCRSEIPHLASLAEKYGRQGVEVVGLSVEDPSADRDKVQRFKERFRMGYTVGFSSQELLEAYVGPGQQPIPQSLVFDRQGRLQAHLVGFDPRRDPPRLESLITRLL